MAMIEENTMAPDFSATDAEGKEIHLADYQGKNTVYLILNRGFQ
jgi:peroxiredoxin